MSFPLTMVIFHSYVSLPEGIYTSHLVSSRLLQPHTRNTTPPSGYDSPFWKTSQKRSHSGQSSRLFLGRIRFLKKIVFYGISNMFQPFIILNGRYSLFTCIHQKSRRFSGDLLAPMSGAWPEMGPNFKDWELPMMEPMNNGIGTKLHKST